VQVHPKERRHDPRRPRRKPKEAQWRQEKADETEIIEKRRGQAVAGRCEETEIDSCGQTGQEEALACVQCFFTSIFDLHATRKKHCATSIMHYYIVRALECVVMGVVLALIPRLVDGSL
jgi:hypothetical protein